MREPGRRPQPPGTSTASATLDGLLTAAQTLARIRSEAAVATRAEQDYSVAVFAVDDPDVDPGSAQQLVVAARRAMLSGDDLGWLDADRLALSLPLASPADALAKAAQIARDAGAAPATVYCKMMRSDESHAVRPIAELLHDPLPRWKRAVDVLGASVALVLVLPALLVAAAMVRWSSPGPVILRQRRVGLHGVPFVLYKFRTMVDGAEHMKAALLAFNERSGPVFKMKNDPRVTRLGRMLRATSFDELPQLWNVLRGDMSLVGPRPPTPDEVPAYRAWHRNRLGVRPGITGSWQVSARDGVDFDDWVRMDLRYVAERSPLVDLRLLAATVPAVLSRRGAV